MRIALVHNGVAHWLAGNPALDEREHTGAGNLRIAPAIITQVDTFIRAARARPRDRRNLQTEISFSTHRLFATADAAEQWAMNYEAAYPRTGHLILQSVIPGGGVTQKYLADAVVEPPARVVIGVSVDLNYRVIGSAIVSTPPG